MRPLYLPKTVRDTRGKVRYTPTAVGKKNVSKQKQKLTGDRFKGTLPTDPAMRAFVKQYGRLPHDTAAFKQQATQGKPYPWQSRDKGRAKRISRRVSYRGTSRKAR